MAVWLFDFSFSFIFYYFYFNFGNLGILQIASSPPFLPGLYQHYYYFTINFALVQLAFLFVFVQSPCGLFDALQIHCLRDVYRGNFFFSPALEQYHEPLCATGWPDFGAQMVAWTTALHIRHVISFHVLLRQLFIFFWRVQGVWCVSVYTL